MTKDEIDLLIGLISEYELRAKYNNDIRDYKTYSMLLKVMDIVKNEVEK